MAFTEPRIAYFEMKTWQEKASGSVLAGQAGKLGII